MAYSRILLTALMVCVVLPLSVEADQAEDEHTAFFENRVRPLLVQHCIKCHGPKKQESGLRLDSRALLLRGGDSGPAVVVGKPEQSLLLRAVRHEDDLEMPPDEKLDPPEIAALASWIKQGAVWPQSASDKTAVAKVRGGPITPLERSFWSFQPIIDPPLPIVKDSAWPRNEIDRFVLARLEAAGLKPVAAADKRTLIRRATFDLTGLPPTPQEVQAFLGDNSPDAMAKLVDRLLKSSAYGERWGRHWLDVVRYADTAGETADFPIPEAYRYRNYVIDAFNKDKPYDEFIREQLAGDLVVARSPDMAPDRSEELVTATGFIAISRRFGYDPDNYHYLTIQDTIDTVGQAVLGLTLGCARCHDHKFDPINRTDYYSLYGIFQSTRYAFPGGEHKPRPRDFVPGIFPSEAVRLKGQHDAQLKTIDEEMSQLDGEKKKIEVELKTKPASSAALKSRMEKIIQQRATASERRSKLAKQIPYVLLYGASDGEPKNAHIHLRGDPLRKGDEVPRRNLSILGGEALHGEQPGSGRDSLADWLTRRENPLTARVMVNRIWQYHFGNGLVRTENDFGARGERPTHPALLDHLAARFTNDGWSIKAMHRRIMLSATYRLSSGHDEKAARIDPDAKLLWRFVRRRLSAEEIRDAMLMVSGQLDRSKGGPHPFPPVDSWKFNQHGPFYAIYKTDRRSVYLMVQRLKRHPFLQLFDGADPNVSTPKRSVTTVPTQALYLMNDPRVHQISTALAQRLQAAADTQSERVTLAYSWTLSRDPTDEQLQTALTFMKKYRQQLVEAKVAAKDHEEKSLAAFVRTLLVRNEFLFVD